MSEPLYTGPFVRESNRIEGILRDPTTEEILALENFISLSCLTVGDVEKLVEVFQPGAKLRNKPGMNVRVGNHIPPTGSFRIEEKLNEILERATNNEFSPYTLHRRYESLHPFMDGNGRSGRAVWAWQMVNHNIWPGLKLGFLHAFYYQTLGSSFL